MRGNHFIAIELASRREPATQGMDDTKTTGADSANPYRFERDEALETFARGRIGEAIAKSTASPRQFGYFSTVAAKQIAQYVLEHFARKKEEP